MSRSRLLALCGALAGLALFGSCKDFKTAYDDCVATGRCMPDDVDAGGKGDASVDAGGDGGTDAGSDGGSSCLNGDAGIDPGFGCSCNSDCATGFCVDGVCCNSESCGTCYACNVPGSKGDCAPVPQGQDYKNDCADTGLCSPGTCDGTGACTQPSGISCAPTTCTSANVSTRWTCEGGECVQQQKNCAGGCDGDAGACVGDCDPANMSSCAPGTHCDADLLICQPGNPIGQPCGSGCESGASCVDGVCCSSPSCGPCEQCDAPGNEGHCSARPEGFIPDGGACAGQCLTGKCSGGSCEVDAGALCGGPQGCQGSTTLYVTACDANGTCNTDSTNCSDFGQVCSAGMCVDPSYPNGTQCTSASQCASGHCESAGFSVPTVCCGQSCGTCQRCDSAGWSSCIIDLALPGCGGMDGGLPGTDGGPGTIDGGSTGNLDGGFP